MNLNIRKALFWDVAFDSLDADKNKNLIIARVLNLGNLEEFRNIMHYYGFETIKNEVQKVGDFDPKTLEFVVTYFNLNKEDLQCFKRKQLHQNYWR